MATLALPAPAEPPPPSGVSAVEPPRAPARAPIFNVVLLYEDIPTGRRATCAAMQLATGLAPGARVNQSVWRLELLDQPRFQFRVMAAAAQAHAVVVSSHSTDLPAGVTAWLDAALKDHIGLILIVLSGSDEGWTITIRHAAEFASAANEPAHVDKTLWRGVRPPAIRPTA